MIQITVLRKTKLLFKLTRISSVEALVLIAGSEPRGTGWFTLQPLGTGRTEMVLNQRVHVSGMCASIRLCMPNATGSKREEWRGGWNGGRGVGSPGMPTGWKWRTV